MTVQDEWRLERRRRGGEGPMARTVEDAALLLSAMAGPDPPRSVKRRPSGGSRERYS